MAVRLSILDIGLTKGLIRPRVITLAFAIIRSLLENQHTNVWIDKLEYLKQLNL